MPQFTYTARAINGDLKTATLEAPNRDEVMKQLRMQRLNVVKIPMTVPFLRDPAMVAAALAAGITVVVSAALPLHFNLLLAALAGVSAGLVAERSLPGRRRAIP